MASPPIKNDQGIPGSVSVSDSCLIREHSKELVKILATSTPTRQTLSVELCAQSILDTMEKQEIMNETSAIKSADKLVEYVISRIDNPEKSERIWKILDETEILNDVVKKIKSKRAVVDSPPGMIHHTRSSSTLTEPVLVPELMMQESPTDVSSTSEAATPRSDFSPPCQEMQPTSETTPEIVQCPDTIVEEAMTLKGTYRGLVFDIINVLKDRLHNGKIYLANLAETINDLCTFTGNETVDEVCSPITRNKNCFNPNLALLLEIDGAFCKKQFRDDIRSYRTQLRDFLDSTTLATFTETVMATQYESWTMITPSNSNNEILVSIKISRYYNDVAVSQINYLKTYVFGEHAASILVLQDIHHSVLTITYSMPVEYFLPVLSTVIKKIELLRIVGVLSVMIGDVILPIGEEITEDDLRICDLKQKQKRNWDIKKSIQNSQILQNIDLQQQALSLLQNKLESDSDSQPTEENDGALKPNMSDSNNDKSKGDVSETEEFLQQTLQPTDLQYQTEKELAINDQKITSFPLQDQPIAAIKPDSDQHTIDESSTSGIESEQGDIQMDLTLKLEEISSFLILKEKLMKESEYLKKELELEKEMRKKSTIELEQLKGFRKTDKLLDGQPDHPLEKLSVTEDQFVEELLQEPNKDWYTLGFLLGLYETDTKEIAFTCRPKTIDACLRQIFKRLQSYRIKVTWEQIVDALSCPAMDNKELAEKIRTKFCPDHHYQLTEKDVADHKRYMISNFSFGKRDDAGFVLVSDIIKSIAKAITIDENDIRRVVAGDPQFTMDCNENGETKVRFVDNQKDIPPYVDKERKIYYFVSKICRFGTQKELTFDKDGFVKVEDLLPVIQCTNRFPISSIDEARTYLERAVKYSTSDVLQLIDRQGHRLIRHVLIHPPEGPFKTTKIGNLWSTVKTLLCDELIYPPLKVEKDGFATVKDLLSHSRMQRYYGVREGDIRKLVEETKDPNVTPNKFELKEGPLLMIRAKWGHTIKGVSVYGDRKLSLSDPEIKFVEFLVPRRCWVVTKKQGIHVDNVKENVIELHYSEQILTEEHEIREEYGNHIQIVVINMERAINDGLEFWVNSPTVITCKSKVIPPTYFEKIF